MKVGNETIIEELKRKGYANIFINYQVFKELYEPYKEEMSEIEYAEVLGISYSNYNNIKNKGKRIKILKVEKKRIPEERSGEIKVELRKKGYTNKLIDYQEFFKLYEPYKEEFAEIEFAEVLGISYSSYENIKKLGKRARILKEEKSEILEKRKEEIRAKLRKKGYTNKIIDYKDFKEIYKTYTEEMSETEFAKILGISYGNFSIIKNNGTSAKILKEVKRNIQKKRKEEIRDELRNIGYINRSIDYQEFLELYKKYKDEFFKYEFAEILGISHNQYRNMRRSGRRVTILKEEKGIGKKEREKEIKEELIKKGYQNKLIDYREFLRLYEPYKDDFSQKEFAKMLGISYSNYNNIKNQGTRAKILKEEKRIISEERKEEIRDKLRQKGYTNRLIDYQEFLKLYKEYKEEMNGVEFADILGISYSNYRAIKNQGTKAKILKEAKRIISEEQKEEIREKLRQKGYTNRLIDYQEFLELYEIYKEKMSEIEFAGILEISGFNYNNIRNRKRRAKILKDEDKRISEERKLEIRESIKKIGYTNRIIDYQDFLRLYEEYKEEMSEIEFAEILGISYSNYKNIKNKGTGAKILKEEKRKISEERTEAIKDALRKKGYTNKLIDYQDFLKLYEEYKEAMSEAEFAKLLGISYSSYYSIKRQGKRTKILKVEKRNISEERKEEIRRELQNEYANKPIDYKDFKKLYEHYREEMSEIEFAKILGILNAKYSSLKSGKARAIIKFNYEKLRRIRYQLSLKNRYYSTEELENKCKKYGITLSELISELYPKFNIEQLLQREYIWIGKAAIPEHFQEKYAKTLLDAAKRSSRIFSKRYKLGGYQEDIASEVLIYTLKNKGDIVKNSETEEEAIERIKAYMGASIKFEYISKCKLKGVVSLDESISEDGKRTRYEVIKVSRQTIDLGKKTEEDSAESIIADMKKCFEQGLDNTDAINIVRKKYGLSRKELLKIMEEELSKKVRIAKTASGRVYLGEEYD